MDRINILWVDDEIEMLKPHFLFLEERGYALTPCTNGQDALDLIDTCPFEVILLDENMPGLNGLETLHEIKNRKPQLPVVMITKNEEEHIMEDAIGSKIADYLIKPVNPHQILLSLKKILNHQHLIAEKTTQNYQKEFGKLALELSGLKTSEDWIAHFKKLIYSKYKNLISVRSDLNLGDKMENVETIKNRITKLTLKYSLKSKFKAYGVSKISKKAMIKNINLYVELILYQASKVLPFKLLNLELVKFLQLKIGEVQQ